MIHTHKKQTPFSYIGRERLGKIFNHSKSISRWQHQHPTFLSLSNKYTSLFSSQENRDVFYLSSGDEWSKGRFESLF